jgi:hypothetical protein
MHLDQPRTNAAIKDGTTMLASTTAVLQAGAPILAMDKR